MHQVPSSVQNLAIPVSLKCNHQGMQIMKKKKRLDGGLRNFSTGLISCSLWVHIRLYLNYNTTVWDIPKMGTSGTFWYYILSLCHILAILCLKCPLKQVSALYRLCRTTLGSAKLLAISHVRLMLEDDFWFSYLKTLTAYMQYF